MLKCGNTSIQKLDLRQNPKLETLKCNENQLTQLDLSKNPDIDYLYCSENQLEQLDVSHLQLKYLYCSHNDLEQLDVKNSKWLKELDCSKNRLTGLDLDVTHKPNLVRVECQNNKLTSLILGENQMLEKLNCANNQLTQLNLNNMSALKELNCANNQLTQLNLNNMISLKELKCQNNQLTALDVSSSPDLTKLWLKNNHLTSLNLDNNPNLNSTYTDVYHSDFNNVYTVTLNPDRTFDLSSLPGNFDISRVTGWVHGNAEGNTLTVDEGTNVVYYGYTCRSDIMAASFKLDVTGTGGGSTGGGTVTPPEPPVTPPSGGGSTGGSSGGSDGGAGIAVLAIGGVAVAGLVGYGVYSYVSEQQLKALLPEGVAVPENRAQTALLLWNTAGRPEPAAQPAFPDVADPDTAKAAQWCVEQGLMNLKFRGRFAPDGSSPAYKTLNAYRKLVG